MNAGAIDPRHDAVRPAPSAPLSVTVDGVPVDGVTGQSLAGVLLGSGRTAWRTSAKGAPRGVFCGIGVCFDCIAEVNGIRDVRLCQRRAVDGDEVCTQHDELPDSSTLGPGAS